MILKTINKTHVIILSLFLFFSFIGFAQASTIYFKGPKKTSSGETFIIQAILNPGEDFINAVEGVVVFDPEILELKNISDGGSIVTLWVDKPALLPEGEIKFSGIIPGGFGSILEKEGKIIDMTFTAKKTGIARFDIKNSLVYLHREIPEQDELTVFSFFVSVAASDGDAAEAPLVLDFYPPEPFQIFITSDKNIFDGKSIAIFNTQDKGSGVNRYEIKEKFLGFSGGWKIAESPYPLRHQSLFGIIKVKAVDRVGRERIETYIPLRFLILFLSALFAALFFSIFLVLKKVINKLTKKHR